MGEGPEVQEQPQQQSRKKEYLFGLLKIRSLTEDEKQQIRSRKQARKLHEQQTKVDKKQAKKEGKLEKERLLYEARLEQTKTALATLRRYRPAADDLVGEFETAVSEAAVMSWDGRPADALERLKKVDPANAVQKADERWGKANDKARKTSPGGMEAVKRINLLLAGKDLPLPLDEVAALRREQNLAARPPLADQPPSDDVERATEALLDVQQRLQQCIEAASPTDDELHAVLQSVIERLMRLLARRGVLVEDMGQTYLAGPDADGEEARTLRPLQAAAIT